jgi:hypothetical protein
MTELVLDMKAAEKEYEEAAGSVDGHFDFDYSQSPDMRDEDEEGDSEPSRKASDRARGLGDQTEQKARLRRVRTREGARQFGQPIGSIIREDVVPSVDVERRRRNPAPSSRLPADRRAAAGVRQKVKGTFHHEWRGIRGWDFDEEDIDWNDHIERLRLARKDADELGIEIHGTGMGVDYLESLNAAARMYEEMFPGITYYQKRFAFQDRAQVAAASGSRRASAYNMKITKQYRPYVAHAFFGADPNGGDWDEVGIAFNTSWFGDDDQSDYALGSYGRQVEASGWSSTRLATATEAMDIEGWRTQFLNTFNHEVGHTIAHIALGRFEGENENDKDRHIRGEYFLENLREVFDTYGLSWRDKTPMPGVDRSDDLFHLNKAEITQVLSEYGATNLQELLAECWAEYMMDPEPRAFARDIGALMEVLLNEFLDNEGAR